MNTKNNKRRRRSREKIESVFFELIRTRELSRISVSDICKRAGLNRTTFYANYADIYELADTVRRTLENDMSELYREDIEHQRNSNDYLRLFRHIKEHQSLYQAYFQLGYDNDFRIVQYDTKLAAEHFDNHLIAYHCEFFRGGITSIIKMWLAGGCQETPEEIEEIIRDEYRGRKTGVTGTPG